MTPAHVLSERVHSQILSELGMDASQICISVQHGEVILSGAVDEYHMKVVAEDLAKSVTGVQRVRNLLCVRPDWAEERGPLETEFTRPSDARAATDPNFRLSDAL